MRGKAKNTLKLPEEMMLELKAHCKNLDTVGGDPNDEHNRSGVLGLVKAKKK